MRTLYKIVAYIIVAEVTVQAMTVAFVSPLLLFASALHVGRRVSRASAIPGTIPADATDASTKS